VFHNFSYRNYLLFEFSFSLSIQKKQNVPEGPARNGKAKTALFSWYCGTKLNKQYTKIFFELRRLAAKQLLEEVYLTDSCFGDRQDLTHL
jgi:hypothetical protein